MNEDEQPTEATSLLGLSNRSSRSGFQTSINNSSQQQDTEIVNDDGNATTISITSAYYTNQASLIQNFYGGEEDEEERRANEESEAKHLQLQAAAYKQFLERKRNLVIESLDYIVIDNESRRDQQQQKSHKQERADDVRKWLTSFLIGVVTGVFAFLVHICVSKIFELKFYLTDKFVHHHVGPRLHLGYAIFTSFNLLLTFVGSGLLIFLTPHAIGSGIPEVKGYLNGCRIPKAFNITTLLGKAFGVICSVAASLPVGPEGPMIHIGSLVGGGLGEFRSRTMKCSLPMMEQFRNSRDRRDFILCGAACGVSAAFGAPIGGVLFALEEVSSHWNNYLTWRSFFGSMTACFVMNFCLSGFTGTYIRSYVLFEVSNGARGYRLIEVVGYVVIGVIGGLLGALYTKFIISVNQMRKTSVNKWKLRRLFEILLLVLVFSTVAFYIPMVSKCRTRPDLRALYLTNSTNSSPGRVSRLAAESSSNGTMPYTCGVNQYNELATLFLVKQEDAMRHLISRGLDEEFGMITCLIFTAIYFLFSGYTCGASLSSGLVIPTLLIGAGYGRFIGLLIELLFPSFEVDPGVYALIGAASFMGGVTRMTISMTVILLEITNDLQYLFPIMLVMMISKWTGDLFTHPLYDQLLYIKGVPYLEPEPSFVMTKMRCADIMVKNVICFHETRETVERIVTVLATTEHNSFPVLREESDGNLVFLGLVSRKHLLVLLKYSVLKNRIRFTDNELNRITNGPHIHLHELVRKYKEHHWNQQLSLTVMVNLSSLCVSSEFSLDLAYQLFRSTGCRQLVCVNYRHQVAGIITRQDFKEERIEEIFHKLKIKWDYSKSRH